MVDYAENRILLRIQNLNIDSVRKKSKNPNSSGKGFRIKESELVADLGSNIGRVTADCMIIE